jgi:hypothetical protein
MAAFEYAEGCVPPLLAISSNGPMLPLERVEVCEAGQGVHELHGPYSDAFDHDKAHPEA